MRGHPVVGALFLLAGVAFFVLGATAKSAPAFVRGLPIPPEVVIPFVFWLLSCWFVFFALFFFRPRRGGKRAAFSRG